MHSSLIAWIMRAIPFGTIIMYGALGEIVTEKSGNLNLGVPGIMYLGGFAGFASACAYENTAANPNAAGQHPDRHCSAPLLASMLGGLIYSLPDHLPARQPERHRPGADHFRHGRGQLLRRALSWTVPATLLPLLPTRPSPPRSRCCRGLGTVGQVIFSYGFLVYAAIVLAVCHALVPHPHPRGSEPARRGREPRHRGRRRHQRHTVQVSVHLHRRRHLRHRRPVLRAGLQPGHLGYHRRRSKLWAGWPWRWSSSPPGSRSTPSGVPTCSACCTGCISSCPRCWASRWPAT